MGWGESLKLKLELDDVCGAASPRTLSLPQLLWPRHLQLHLQLNYCTSHDTNECFQYVIFPAINWISIITSTSRIDIGISDRRMFTVDLRPFIPGEPQRAWIPQIGFTRWLEFISYQSCLQFQGRKGVGLQSVKDPTRMLYAFNRGKAHWLKAHPRGASTKGGNRG